jgi:hypothetical protein
VPTDKPTARPRTPHAVWPSSTPSSPPAADTRARAIPECLGNRGICLLFCTNVGRAIESRGQNAKERCFLALSHAGRAGQLLSAAARSIAARALPAWTWTNPQTGQWSALVPNSAVASDENPFAL